MRLLMGQLFEEKDDMEHKTIIIVDGYAVGQQVHEACVRHGVNTVHVRSTHDWLKSMPIPDLSKYTHCFVFPDDKPSESIKDELADLVDEILKCSQMHVVIGKPVLFLYLQEVGLHKFFDMLGYGGLGIIKMIDQVFVAYRASLFVLLHDIPEDLDPCRMGQGVRYLRHQQDLFFLYFIVFFSESHLWSAPFVGNKQLMHCLGRDPFGQQARRQIA